MKFTVLTQLHFLIYNLNETYPLFLYNISYNDAFVECLNHVKRTIFAIQSHTNGQLTVNRKNNS